MIFYFTYGIDDCPFFGKSGGWTEVEADTFESACEAFRQRHPDTAIINCAGIYTEKAFGLTSMKQYGNYGYFCHEKLKGVTLDAES